MDVAPITNGDHAEVIASGMEIRALFSGETKWDDLEWDRDLLIDWYNNVYAPNQNLEPFPTEEGQMAFDEAQVAIKAEVRSILDRRSEMLGNGYPFERDEDSGTPLRRRDLNNCTPQMVSYLWLSFFEAINSEWASIDVNERFLIAFRATFEKIFEAVVCFAMLGKADGPIWYLGNVRGIHKLLKSFRHISRRMGSGLVKTHAQLNLVQRAANDSGIDVVLIERQQDATMFLVGATIQKKNRRSKVIGIDERNRFRGFFVQQIRATTQGIMAVPFPYSEFDAELCLEKDCQYLHLDLIRQKLGLSVGRALGEVRHASLALRSYSRTFTAAAGLSQPLQAAGCQVI
ncbi:MAG: hypothetical protein AB7I42_29880 [Bradyrhizobium sp.]|uniref:hypothetical protein n=1 Tax=Bradyrhizobium sp. TaxID=376 RepID=UPI003D1061EF